MRYIEMSVTRSENLRIVETHAAWELPILQHIHGIESVEVTGEEEVNRDWPQDAAVEYDRLCMRYGKVEGTDQPVASLVYGTGVQGMNRLAQAMAQAKREADDNPIDYATKEAEVAKKAAPKVVVPYEGVNVDTMGMDLATANAVIETANLAS